MSATQLQPQTDPLFSQPLPERPAYATGMLLDVQDFSDEQTYHRGRLARALGALAGDGTLAGLKVSYQPAQPAAPGKPATAEEIRVEPGLAVDRLGRLVELQRPACTRLARWFDGLRAADVANTTDLLKTSRYEDFTGLLSARATATPPPARALVADVYIRFVACPRGYTPAFASGPFDALDAVSTSRVRDAYELLLLPRPALGAARSGLPDAGTDFAAIADAAARQAALQDAVLGAWTGSGLAAADGALPPRAEDPPGNSLVPDPDPTAVFLARVLIPVTADDPPLRDGAAVLVDNWRRRFLPGQSLLARWTGAA